MTLFKRSNDIEVSVSPEFDKRYEPGETPSRAGIYRCAGCGCEAIADSSKALPLHEHSRHLLAQGSIQWRLAVAAQQEPH